MLDKVIINLFGIDLTINHSCNTTICTISFSKIR